MLGEFQETCFAVCLCSTVANSVLGPARVAQLGRSITWQAAAAGQCEREGWGLDSRHGSRRGSGLESGLVSSHTKGPWGPGQLRDQDKLNTGLNNSVFLGGSK